MFGEVRERVRGVPRRPVHWILDRESEAFTVGLVVRIFTKTDHLDPSVVPLNATDVINVLVTIADGATGRLEVDRRGSSGCHDILGE